jgi:hypothetical protein
MFDFSLPWPIWLLLPYLSAPLAALAGAILGSWLGFRRFRSFGRAALCGLVGSQLGGWALLLLIGSWGGSGAAVRLVGVLFLTLFAGTFWLLRRRGHNEE